MQERAISKEYNITQSGPKDEEMFSLIQKNSQSGGYNLNQEAFEGGASEGESSYQRKKKKGPQHNYDDVPSASGKEKDPLLMQERMSSEEGVHIFESDARTSGPGAFNDVDNESGDKPGLPAFSGDLSKDIEAFTPSVEDSFAGDEGDDQAGAALAGEESSEAPEIFNSESSSDLHVFKDDKVSRDEETEKFQNLLLKGIEATLGKLSWNGDAQKNIKNVKKIQTLTVSSQRFKGYLFIASATDNFSSEKGLEFLENLIAEMANKGESLKPTKEVVEVNLEEFDFSSWAEENADFSLMGSLDSSELLLAYLSVERFPDVSEQNSDGFLAIKSNEYLMANTDLSFDLYLHMPANAKYILYLKKGASISAQTIDKFVKFKVASIYIKQNDMSAFISYFLKNKLAA